jgi:hypothetical protein
MVTPAAGDGRMRASHADREQVVDVLKAAFVQGRLTQDELDTRVGQALAARTYAALTALTADVPAEAAPAPAPALAPAPAPAPAQAPAAAAAQAQEPALPARRLRNVTTRQAFKAVAVAIAATVVAVTVGAVAAGQPEAAVILSVFVILFAAVTTAFVTALIALALKVESRQRSRSAGQLPPGPASGKDSAVNPGPADPAGPRRPADPAGPRRPADPAGPRRRPSRRPHGSLAVGNAG